jgi:hypothetical protein
MGEISLPRVLIVSIPKGGTHLLMQAVLGIPGMTQTRKNVFKPSTNPILPGQMGVMHLPHSRQIERFLKDNQVKVLFISRDPRDIAVSMMHFIANAFPSHVLYPAFQQFLVTKQTRLSAIINGVKFNTDIVDTVLANSLHVASGFSEFPNIFESCSPYLPWCKARNACHVTFEELAQPSDRRTKALGRIVDFLLDDPSSLQMPKPVMVAKMEQNINPAVSPTFRAGRVGDWKLEFEPQHKADFKRIAGDMLIDLGYEHDLSW